MHGEYCRTMLVLLLYDILYQYQLDKGICFLISISNHMIVELYLCTLCTDSIASVWTAMQMSLLVIFLLFFDRNICSTLGKYLASEVSSIL